MNREATSAGIIGRTTVRLYALVWADGHVQEVRIDRSSSNSVADAAAVRVMESANFNPGQVEGIPAPIWVLFPVTFEPERQRRAN